MSILKGLVTFILVFGSLLIIQRYRYLKSQKLIGEELERLEQIKQNNDIEK